MRNYLQLTESGKRRTRFNCCRYWHHPPQSVCVLLGLRLSIQMFDRSLGMNPCPSVDTKFTQTDSLRLNSRQWQADPALARKVLTQQLRMSDWVGAVGTA